MLKRIRRRYETAVAVLPKFQLTLAYALRQTLKEGLDRQKIRTDVLAGLVVGVVALPLSMALAIATGVAPQHGLYTAIIAGAVIAILGGSRTQVSGPTAAFVVVLVPIAVKHGIGGLLVATVMAGLFLIALGGFRLGRLIEFIPYPVTTGFTAGIAVVIATMQLKDLLGLEVAKMPEHYLERVYALAIALPTAHLPDVVLGALTFAILIAFPRYSKRVPAPLVALTVAGVVGFLLGRFAGFQAATIGSRFSYMSGGVLHAGIPQLPPLPSLPWNYAGPDGQPIGLSIGLIRELVPSAFTIAMLGAIESLLSAVVSDGMAGTKHSPDGELVAQGIGNVVAPFFGGFAATGAIARTATNIRSGARSPIAAVVHAVVVLVAVCAAAPLLGYLPMASLAALLLIVAYNMSELKHFRHVVEVAPKSDVLVQIACFGTTIVFDMVVSVTTGVLLAALLFMRRMAEITGARVAEPSHPALREPLPAGIVLYEIAGPLFFGAAQRAIGSLQAVADQAKIFILDLSAVPAIDATGLVGLESLLERLWSRDACAILAGVQAHPRKVLARAGMEPREGKLVFSGTVDAAIEAARKHLEALTPPPPPSSRRSAAPPSHRHPAVQPS